MFKNRSFNVKVVKDEPAESTGERDRVHDFAHASVLVHEIASSAIAVFAVCKAISTICSTFEHVVVTKVK